MLCLLSCRLSRDFEVKRVYPKLSSIGFMMHVSGADRVAWGYDKGLTDVCWEIPEVDAVYLETIYSILLMQKYFCPSVNDRESRRLVHIPEIIVIANGRPKTRRTRVMAEDIGNDLILSYKLGRRVRVCLLRL